MTLKTRIGTVGLGLMGSSIATCLLATGHEVTSLVRHIEKTSAIINRIINLLQKLREEGLLKGQPEEIIQRLTITDNLALLEGHEIVIESIIEDINEKKLLFHRLESVLTSTAIIGSNTSAIPISILQRGLKYPERLIGIHWGEPAHVSRFLEVICGNESDINYAQRIMALAENWGKEPSLIRKDIRGFITNRLMYAMLREAFHLVEEGYASYEDIDRACRNDFGYWITFTGLFRFMDLTGIPAYLAVMKDLFPELDHSLKVPRLMEEMVASGAKGVSNATGFYPYTTESAEHWERLFVEFTYEIRKLSVKYSQNIKELSI